MSRFQTLIFFIFVNFISETTRAVNCLDYSIHGVVKEKDHSIVMLLHPDSRSEIKVQFPDSMQKVLKNNLGDRIQVDAPAAKIDDYLYQVYYLEGKIKSFPFSSEKHDQIKALGTQKPFPCEK